MIVFNGYDYAARHEDELREQVNMLNRPASIAAILFREDKGSQLYTNLKHQAAERVRIGYEIHHFSMHDPIVKVQQTIADLNGNPNITGIIIQKPLRKRWVEAVMEQEDSEVPEDSKQAFARWWHSLVDVIDLKKDVDGLHPKTLAAIKTGSWQEQGLVLPATAQAVISILEGIKVAKNATYAVIGRSEILGLPLFYELENMGKNVELMGQKELTARVAAHQGLKDKDVIISATGQAGIITAELIKPGVVLIDVGEPKADVNRESVADVPSFLTPVPGGVGPVTIISLLKNAVQLVTQ